MSANNYGPHEKGAPPPDYNQASASAPITTPPPHDQQIYPAPAPGGDPHAGMTSPYNNDKYPQQQPYPPQQQYGGPPGPPQAGRRNYQNATPLFALSEGPAPVDCPCCGVREVTRVNYVSGSTTHIVAILCCCVTMLGCIPYLMSSCKDVQHRCGACGTLLATWKRSGSVIVHQHV